MQGGQSHGQKSDGGAAFIHHDCPLQGLIHIDVQINDVGVDSILAYLNRGTHGADDALRHGAVKHLGFVSGNGIQRFSSLYEEGIFNGDGGVLILLRQTKEGDTDGLVDSLQFCGNGNAVGGVGGHVTAARYQIGGTNGVAVLRYEKAGAVTEGTVRSLNLYGDQGQFHLTYDLLQGTGGLGKLGLGGNLDGASRIAFIHLGNEVSPNQGNDPKAGKDQKNGKDRDLQSREKGAFLFATFFVFVTGGIPAVAGNLSLRSLGRDFLGIFLCL